MLKELFNFFKKKPLVEVVQPAKEIYRRFGVYGWVKHDGSNNPPVPLNVSVVVEEYCGCIGMDICGMIDWEEVDYYLLDEYYTQENSSILDKAMRGY